MSRRTVSLDPDQIQLLRDVRDGKVARHRLGRGRSPALGQDYQQAPGHGPGDLRKAAVRLAVLKRLGLVQLPALSDTDAAWPWKTTRDGDVVLEHLDDTASVDVESTPA